MSNDNGAEQPAVSNELGVTWESVMVDQLMLMKDAWPDRSQWRIPEAGELEHISLGLRTLAVPLEVLREDPNNANTHDDASIESIMSSLARFGQRKTIVVNSNGMILEAGEGTLVAMRRLGKKYVAVNFENDDPVTHTGFGLADNRTAELSERDPQKLLRLLLAIKESGTVSLEDTGYNDATVQFMKDSIENFSGAGEADVDNTPPPTFPEYGEDIAFDYRCPKCDYHWSGKAR